MTAERQFIKNKLFADVDGLKGVVIYEVYGEYEVLYKDAGGEFYKIELELIDKIEYPWELIEKDGGVGQVVKEIYEMYNIAE